VVDPREEGIYKSRKVMVIPRKVVQDFFLTELCVCERTQTNLLSFLFSVSFKRPAGTNNMFRAPSVTATFHGELSLHEQNFFVKEYLKLT
jgi:hypothetical protein